MTPSSPGDGLLSTLPSPADGAPTRGKFKPLFSPENLVIFGILLLTLAAYFQVASFRFVSFDDPVYVTDNPNIHAGLGWESLRYAFTSGDDGSYLPLVWLSHAACTSLFGTWAGGHHLVNVVLHAANAVLLFLFLKKITKSMVPSAVVAFLFALHPLHVESVAWISERKDVLSTLFWILTSWAYVRYTEQPSLRRYLGMALLFVLGLLSKSMLVTLPLTLLLFDVWPLRRICWEGDSLGVRLKASWPLIMEKLPLLVLSLAAAGATLATQAKIGAMASTLPLQFRLGNAALASVKYIEQTFYPVGLSVFYQFRLSQFPTAKVAGSLAVLVIISAVCLWNLKRRPYLAVGWFWYLVTLLPVIGIIQVGGQAHADRYTYVPLIGLFIMLAWSAEELTRLWRVPRIGILAISAMILSVMFMTTVAQIVVWRDSLTLFKNALILDSENPLAILNIGDAFFLEGHFEDAYTAYAKGVRLASNVHWSHLKAGLALEKMGFGSEALSFFKEAKRLSPGLLRMDQCLGHTLTHLGRFEEAAPFVQRVVQHGGSKRGIYDQVDPLSSRLDWAVILASRNQLPEARKILAGLQVREGHSTKGWLAIGQTYLTISQPEEALPLLEKASEQSPSDTEALFYLGIAFAQLNRTSEARGASERLAQVVPQSNLLKKQRLELESAIAKGEKGATPGGKEARSS